MTGARPPDNWSLVRPLLSLVMKTYLQWQNRCNIFAFFSRTEASARRHEVRVTREENSAEREMTPLALVSIRLSRLGRTHATFCNIVGLCKGAGKMCATSCNILKCCNKNVIIFKLDPSPSNIPHVTTRWPNVCNTLRAKILQDVSLNCCVCT